MTNEANKYHVVCIKGYYTGRGHTALPALANSINFRCITSCCESSSSDSVEHVEDDSFNCTLSIMMGSRICSGYAVQCMNLSGCSDQQKHNAWAMNPGHVILLKHMDKANVFYFLLTVL